MMSSLGSPLIYIVLVLTYKSIHVHKSAQNDKFWHSGTSDIGMNDQC